MTKDEALKQAQDLCPYFDEISKGAFYEGFIKALDQLPDTTKMMGLIPSEWVGLTDDEIAEAVGSQLDEVYLTDFRKVIAKLKEKNK